MSCSEGDRFVLEIQPREVMRPPLLVPASPELERAGDPEIACMEAEDLVAGMKNPAITRPGTARRDGLDITHGGDAISRWTPLRHVCVSRSCVLRVHLS